MTYVPAHRSPPSCEAELDALLSEPRGDAAERARTAFDLATRGTRGLVLVGAGNLGRRTLRGLRALGVEPLAFADNDRSRWGGALDGVPIVAPADAVAANPDAAFVVCIWRAGATERYGAHREALAALGCRTVTHAGFLFWRHPNVFLPHYAMSRPEHVLDEAHRVRAAFGLWADDASRREYVAQLRWRLHLDFDVLPDPLPETGMYYPDDLYRLGPDETVVDCGVFDGDTLRSTLRHAGGNVARAIGFEPDALSRERALAWRDTLPPEVRGRVEIRPQAVGAVAGRIRFGTTGTPSSTTADDGVAVECVTLDSALDGVRPTFMKLDIEGAELDAITGARALIARHAPIVAVCAYHVQAHPWQLPLALRACAPSYRFWLRPYGLEVWDLVCYAVPRDRVLAGAPGAW